MTKASFESGALYIVATPLGNLGDITRRAVDCLAAADAIACEDTRHARTLLDHLGVRAASFALHEHNEAEATAKLLGMLAAGQRVALISDAGTPGISDPGARAVAATRTAGYRVVPIPGANAAIAALSASGLTDERFLFAGFLPTKAAARRAALEALAGIDAALVFYESPHRIEECIADMVAVLQTERTLVVARELTKLFEQIAAVPLGEAPAWFAADANRRRGEFVLLLSAPPLRTGLSAEAERTLKLLLADLPLKQAVRLAAEISGASRNELYERALALKAQPL